MILTASNDHAAPYTVALVAMGPSHRDYLSECIAASGRRMVADETWAINAMAGIIEHDRAIIMDDLDYFAKQGRTAPHLQGYATWLHRHPGPIYTTRALPAYPGSVAYPLEEVLNTIGYPYLNSTVAYSVALAIHFGVRHLKLYGMDFTQADNRGFAEAGRACVEYWLRDAVGRGMQITIAPSCSLCDQALGRPLYGYSEPPSLMRDDAGHWQVQFAEPSGALPARGSVHSPGIPPELPVQNASRSRRAGRPPRSK